MMKGVHDMRQSIMKDKKLHHSYVITAVTVLLLFIFTGLYVSNNINKPIDVQAAAYGDTTTEGMGSTIISDLETQGNGYKGIYRTIASIYNDSTRVDDAIFYVYVPESNLGALQCYIVGVQQAHRGDSEIIVPAKVVLNTKNADDSYSDKIYDVIGLGYGLVPGYSMGNNLSGEFPTKSCFGFAGMSNLENVTFKTDENFRYIRCIGRSYFFSSSKVDSGDHGTRFLFSGTRITSLDLPNTIIEIGANDSMVGSYALGDLFKDTILTTVNFDPINTCYINVPLFKDASNLKKFTINENIIMKSGYIFQNTDLSEGVTIKNPTTHQGIYDNTFYGSNISNITFEGDCSNLVSIGDSAFYNCKFLTSIDLSNTGVKTLGNNCFYGATKLSNVVLSNVLESIGDSCFKGNSVLKHIIFPDTLKSIGIEAFLGTILESVEFENTSLKSIGISAFNNIKSLSGAVVLPDTFETLGNHAFVGTSITSLTMNNFKSIDDFAFFGCQSLVEATLKTTYAEADVNIGNYMFGSNGTPINSWSPDGALEVINLDGVKNIPAFFAGTCTNLRAVNGLDAVKTIGRYAFCGTHITANNNGMLELTNLEAIVGEYAFSDCDDIVTVHAPKLTSITAPNAFANCDNLESVTMEELETIYGETFCNDSKLSNVYFPKAKVTNNNAFKGTALTHIDTTNFPVLERIIGSFPECIKLETVDIPHVTEVGRYAFIDCTKLTTINMPVVESIDEYAFKNCVSLNNVILPHTLTKIGIEAFSNCDSLTSITIPNSVATIDTSVFNESDKLESILFEAGSAVTVVPEYFAYSCDSLKTIRLPERVQTIDDRAFHGCVALQDFVMPETLVNINDYAFCDCDSLITLTCPSSVKFIGIAAFRSCDNLTIFNMPNTSELETLGVEAFKDCVKLDNIVLGRNLQSMGASCFLNCVELKHAKFLGNNITVIPNSAFYNTKLLEEVTLPDSITTIDEYAYCYTGAKTINLDELLNLTAIGARAFFNAENVKKIEIPAKVISIGEYAFDDLSSLEELKFSSVSEITALPKYFVSDNQNYKAKIYLPNSLTTLAQNAFGSADTYTFDTPTTLTTIGNNLFYESANNVYDFPATQSIITNLISYNSGLSFNFDTYSREVKNFTFADNSTVVEIHNSFVRIGESIKFPDSLRFWYQDTKFRNSYYYASTEYTNRRSTYFNGTELDLNNIEYVGYRNAANDINEDIRYDSGFLWNAPYLEHDKFTASKLKYFCGLQQVGTEPIDIKTLCPDIISFNGLDSVTECDLTTYLPDGLIVLAGAGKDAMTVSSNVVKLPDCEKLYIRMNNDPYSVTDCAKATILLPTNCEYISGTDGCGLCHNGNVKFVVPDTNTKLTYDKIKYWSIFYNYSGPTVSSNVVNKRWNLSLPNRTYRYQDAYLMGEDHSMGECISDAYINLYYEDESRYVEDFNRQVEKVVSYEYYLTPECWVYLRTMNTALSAETQVTTNGVNIKATISNDTDYIRGKMKVYSISGDEEEFIKEVSVTSSTSLINILDSEIPNGASAYKLYFESEVPTLKNANTTVSYDKSALRTVIDAESEQNEEEKTVTITGVLYLEDDTSIKVPKGTLSIYYINPTTSEEIYIKSATENDLTISYTMNEDSTYLRSGTNNYVIKFKSSDTSTYQDTFANISVSYTGADAGLDGDVIETQGGMTVNAVIDSNALNYGELSIFLGDNNLAEKINANNGTTAYIEPKKLQIGENTVTLVYETNTARYFSDRKEITFNYNPVETELALSLLFNTDGDKLNIDAHIANEDLTPFEGTLKVYKGSSDLGVLIKSGTTTSITTQIDRSQLDFGGNDFFAEWIPSNTYTSYASVIKSITVNGREVTLNGGINNLGSTVGVTAKAICDTLTLDPHDISMYLGSSEYGVPLDVGVNESGTMAVAVVDKHMLNVGANNFFIVYEPSSNEFSRQTLTLQWSMASDGSELIPTDPGIKPEDLEKIVEAIVDLHNAFDIDIEKLIAVLDENFELLDGDLKALKEQLLALTNAQKDYSDKYDSIISALEQLVNNQGSSDSVENINDTLKDMLEKFEEKLSSDDKYHEQVVNALKQLEKIDNLNNNLESIEQAIKDGTMSEKEINDTLKDMNDVINSAFDTTRIENSLKDLQDVLREQANSNSDISDTLEDINNSINNTNNSVRDVSDTIDKTGQDVVNALNNINNNNNAPTWDTSGLENALNNIANNNNAPSANVNVDTKGIEDALNNLINSNKTDGSKEVVDAIERLTEALTNNNNNTTPSTSTDVSGIENLLKELVEAEKSGNNPVSIDMTGIEDALRSLIDAYPKDQRTDLSGITDAIKDLKDAMIQSQNNNADVVKAINDLINQMRTSSQGHNNSTNNGYSDPELVSAINRLGTLIGNSQQNNGGNSVDSQTMKEILGALKDLNTSISNNAITKDALKDIVDAINGIEIKVPDMSDQLQALTDSTNALSDIVKEMKEERENYKPIEQKDNSLTSALINGLFSFAGMIAAGFIVRGGVMKAHGQDRQLAEDQEDNYLNAQNQSNSNRRHRS